MKKIFWAVLLILALMLSSCGEKAAESKLPDDKTTINIAVLKGPTGMGAVKLMEDNSMGNTANNYNFTVSSAPDEVTAKIISGELDIAAVPTNIAAVLYNKTEGEVQLAAVNTLGVLYLLENGNEIKSVSDLSGKTLHVSGQGATPEYVTDYLLKSNGVENVDIKYYSDHAELAALVASGEVKLAVLPEPNVTAVMLKNSDLRIALNFTDEWNKINNESVLAMGCIAVRKDFAETNQEAFEGFLNEYKASIEYVNENTAESAALIEKYGIMANAEAAEAAIPNCNIVYISGEKMIAQTESFYKVLYDANPKTVGGKLPDENFYYSK